MFKRRLLIIRSIAIISIILVAIKLFSIQAVTGRRFSSAAAIQQTRNFAVFKERGDILDRNGISFTGRQTKWKAILQPSTLLNNPMGLRLTADIFDMTLESLKNKLSGSYLPCLLDITPAKAKAVADSSISGVSVIDMRVRNSAETLASHIIGYVDKKGEQGMAGIEKVFQKTLERGGGVYTGIIADAGNEFMRNFGYRIWDDTGKEKLNVRLTIDYHFQCIVEDVMDRMVDRGAVVIIDIINGEILAMASRPDFDPSNINPLLNDADQALFNRALGTYIPGSIFKIITACAALEKNISADLTYDCPGYVELDGIKMKCSSYENGGHGYVNMAQAFARSCNSYFINLGLKIGKDNLLEMASCFGLGKKTGLYTQGIDESSGQLPETIGYTSSVEIGNISIGQGDILVSPVQAANMTAAIANGGILNQVSLVHSITNEKGEKIRNVSTPSWKRIISKETAASLQGMMLLTVQSGTGGLADIKGYGGSAGKTGSAETGWIRDNRNVLHAWFSGYFPIDAPRYALCVFIEDGKSGSSSAAPIFAEISAKIMDEGY